MVWDHEDSDGCQQSGSAYIEDSEDAPHQCVALTGGQHYYFGARVKPDPLGIFYFCKVYTYKSNDCSGDWLEPLGEFDGQAGAQGWMSYSSSFTATAGAESGLIRCAAHEVKMDQLYINPNYNHF
jgi:hypothetical protein